MSEFPRIIVTVLLTTFYLPNLLAPVGCRSLAVIPQHGAPGQWAAWGYVCFCPLSLPPIEDLPCVSLFPNLVIPVRLITAVTVKYYVNLSLNVKELVSLKTKLNVLGTLEKNELLRKWGHCMWACYLTDLGIICKGSTHAHCFASDSLEKPVTFMPRFPYHQTKKHNMKHWNFQEICNQKYIYVLKLNVYILHVLKVSSQTDFAFANQLLKAPVTPD